MSPTRLFGKRPTTAEERQLALRIAAVFAIPMALIMIIPLIGAGIIWRHEVQARLNDDLNLVRRLDRERLERAEAINEFVFQQCIEAEVRDVVIVQQLKAAIIRARASLPPGPLLRQQVQALKDGINVLEPADEPDCNPPAAVKPTRGPP